MLGQQAQGLQFVLRVYANDDGAAPVEVSVTLYCAHWSPEPSFMDAGIAADVHVTVPLAFEQFALAFVKSLHDTEESPPEVAAVRSDTVAVVPDGREASSTHETPPTILVGSAVLYAEEVSVCGDG